MKTRLLAVALLVFSFSIHAFADVPRTINYQGILADDEGGLITGDHSLTFTIYPDSTQAATVLWTENQATVHVEGGLFNVILGGITAIPDSLLMEDSLWMGIQVDSDPEMVPRMTITSVPWAMRAAQADSAFVVGSLPAHNHDDRYYTETELNSAGTINSASNPVDWTKLKSVPGGLADGVDDIGGDGHSLDAADGSPTNVVYVDNAGDVGVGITSPGYKLHVNGTLYANTLNTGQGDNELYDMNQNVTTTSNPSFNRVYLSDYGTALGGFHVGGTTDPGTDNLAVDGEVTATGGLITGESASGETVRFGTKTSVMADINPIVTCRSGYFWWDYSERTLMFTETNAHNGYARYSGRKNEGSGPVLFDGFASYEATKTVATLNSNMEYATVEVTSEGSNGGYIHLHCMQSNLTFVAHYWFRYQ